MAARHPRRQRRVGDRLDDLARQRTLHGDHRPIVDRVGDLDVGKPLGVIHEPGEVALVVGRVGHRQVAVAVEAVGEQVVQHAAVLAAQHAVLRAANGEPGDVVGEQPLQQLERLRAARLDLAHVRDVEQPARPAHRHVLLAYTGVLHRHLPAGEVDELRAGRHMGVEQGGAAKSARHRRSGYRGQPTRSGAPASR